jgi:hypothetical protein
MVAVQVAAVLTDLMDILVAMEGRAVAVLFGARAENFLAL